MKMTPWTTFAAAISLTTSISFAQGTYDGQAGPPANKLVLWYRQAATNWMTSALPIGNGRRFWYNEGFWHFPDSGSATG